MFDFGGGVNKNPAGGTTNMTGSMMPVGQTRTTGQPSSGSPAYPANGYSYGTTPPTGLPGSPFPQLPTNAFNQLYGGLGPYLSQFINSGAGYNPQVLQSLVNQIQPQVNEGLATLGATAGATGNRYGSAYQIGTADYLSQVNQNELGMASGLYENSVQNTLGLLGNIYPLQAQYHNNQGGFLSSLLSSLIPTAGGIVGGLAGIPGLGGSLGGSGGGLGLPGGSIGVGGGGSNASQYPIPGTNENWGGVYNPNQANNPPASGNTGIPGGAISGDAGNALLNYLAQNFNQVPGSQNPLSPSQISQQSGGPNQAPTIPMNQTGNIPGISGYGGGGDSEASTYDFFSSLDL